MLMATTDAALLVRDFALSRPLKRRFALRPSLPLPSRALSTGGRASGLARVAEQARQPHAVLAEARRAHEAVVPRHAAARHLAAVLDATQVLLVVVLLERAVADLAGAQALQPAMEHLARGQVLHQALQQA